MPAYYTTLSEQLVATRSPVISLSSINGTSAFRDKLTEIGSGTVTNTNGEIILDTGVTSASEAFVTTSERGVTTGSNGALSTFTIRASGSPTGAQAGLWGYFDDDNGVGFGIDATSFFVFSRKAGADTKVAQASWNTDELDGSGTSSLTLSATNTNMYQIEFTTYGSVIFRVIVTNATGIETSVVAHVLVQNTPVMNATNLPLNIQVLNGVTASSFKLFVGSREFSVLGPKPHNDRLVSHFENNLSLNNSGFVNFLNLRKKTTEPSQYINAYFDSIEFFASAPLLIQMLSDVTVDAASWQAPSIYPADETICEVDKTDTTPSGTIVFSQFVVPAEYSCTKIHKGTSEIASGRIYAIKAKTIIGTATASCNLRWVENW